MEIEWFLLLFDLRKKQNNQCKSKAKCDSRFIFKSDMVNMKIIFLSIHDKLKLTCVVSYGSKTKKPKNQACCETKYFNARSWLFLMLFIQCCEKYLLLQIRFFSIKLEKLNVVSWVVVCCFFFSPNSQYVTTAISFVNLPLLLLKHVSPLMYVVMHCYD